MFRRTSHRPLPPCPAYFELGSQACPPTSYQDNEFTIPQNGGGVDNAFVTIEIEWLDPNTDLDTEIYRVRTTQQLLIARSQSKPINFGAACPRSISANAGRDKLVFARRTCLSPRRGIRGKRVGPAALSRTRRGIDRYCVVGGGILRAGYPTRRLSSGMSSRTRRRIRKRAVLAISTNKRFRLRKLRVGSRTKTLRKRLRGERRIRVGRNVWYTAKGKRARLLFRTRGGRVGELGLGDKRLTATSRGTVRFLRAWDRRGL